MQTQTALMTIAVFIAIAGAVAGVPARAIAADPIQGSRWGELGPTPLDHFNPGAWESDNFLHWHNDLGHKPSKSRPVHAPPPVYTYEPGEAALHPIR